MFGLGLHCDLFLNSSPDTTIKTLREIFLEEQKEHAVSFHENIFAVQNSH